MIPMLRIINIFGIIFLGLKAKTLTTYTFHKISSILSNMNLENEAKEFIKAAGPLGINEL